VPNPNDSADFYRTGSEQENENNNASECSEALEERSAVSLNITLRVEKVQVLRSILATCERFTLEGELVVHGRACWRPEVGKSHQILQVVCEAVSGVGKTANTDRAESKCQTLEVE
jgi:hypothetical protein